VSDKALFPLGQTVMTAGFEDLFGEYAREVATIALTRHVHGDWGDLDNHDRAVNARALRDGGRLMSVYKFDDGLTHWVITEADRSVTTVLLPHDY